MSHQIALSSVTAQAIQPEVGLKVEGRSLPGITPSLLPPFNPASLQLRPASSSLVGSSSIPEKVTSITESKARPSPGARKRLAGDGFNWRKYGQKQVKGLDSSRSYYRCTSPNCAAKKKVEQNSAGEVTEVVYEGWHSHDPPQKVRCTKDGRFLPGRPEYADALEGPPTHCSSDCKKEHSDESNPKQRCLTAEGETKRQEEEETQKNGSANVVGENYAHQQASAPNSVPDFTAVIKSYVPDSGSNVLDVAPGKKGEDSQSFAEPLAGGLVSSTVNSVAPDELKPVQLLTLAGKCMSFSVVSSDFEGKSQIPQEEVFNSVTAQAAQAQAGMKVQDGVPSCITTQNPVTVAFLPPLNTASFQKRPTSPAPEGTFSVSEKTTTVSEPKPQPSSGVKKRSLGDGFNWRKYGQKQMKNPDSSRSYYRCTYPSCVVKKKVEQNSVGEVTEVVYKGHHGHEPPPKVRCTKDEGFLVGAPESIDPPEELPVHRSSDCDEEQRNGVDPKRRIKDSTKNIVQMASDPGTQDDGYRWRKYGQKMVKGSPNPRSYYKCTYAGCPVRKHVEKGSNNAKTLLVTYEGQHNHERQGVKKFCDSSAAALLLAAAAITKASDQAGSYSQLSNAEVEFTPGKTAELGGEKALESAEALLSIGLSGSSSSEGKVAAKSPDMIRRALFHEAHAVVCLKT